MAKYILKRKNFNFVKETAGTVANTTGSVLSSGLGKTAGTLAGAATGFGLMAPLPIPGSGLVGAAIGAKLGKKATKFTGDTLKSVGNQLKNQETQTPNASLSNIDQNQNK